MKIIIGLFVVLSFSFYSCQEDKGETKTHPRKTIRDIDTTDCGKSVSSIEEARILNSVTDEPALEMNAEEKDISVTVIGILGDVGFYWKVGVDTLSVVVFSKKYNLKSMKNRESHLQSSLLDFRSETKDVVYAFYYSEDLSKEDSLSKFKPIRAVKFRMK